MKQDIAIKVDQVSKIFKIPHENRNTIRERIINFRKKTTYEKFEALNDVSFEIRKGEFFGIIGRNGSGKSTLLKILAGIYTPDRGSVQVNGEISPFLELGVGFNPELSGKDNIYLNGTILGLTKKEIDEKFNQIVEFSELERFINLKVKNYSSGMQVRLAFSVAIHANKEILLMDEVLAVGDASFQVKCFNVFEEIIKEGKTIVFVSHDTSSIQKYANRVLYLESGRAAFTGNPNEALNKYMYTDVIKETPAVSVAVNEVGNEQPAESQVKEDPKKVVEITGVSINNKDGVELKNLNHGETFFINVSYCVTANLKDLIFGITIRDQSNHDLFTTNTFTERIETGDIEIGKLVVSYEISNFLSSGKYALSAAVCDKTQRIFYDWKDEIETFYVTNNNRIQSYGGVELPHKISFTRER